MEILIKIPPSFSLVFLFGGGDQNKHSPIRKLLAIGNQSIQECCSFPSSPVSIDNNGMRMQKIKCQYRSGGIIWEPSVYYWNIFVDQPATVSSTFFIPSGPRYYVLSFIPLAIPFEARGENKLGVRNSPWATVFGHTGGGIPSSAAVTFGPSSWEEWMNHLLLPTSACNHKPMRTDDRKSKLGIHPTNVREITSTSRPRKSREGGRKTTK